MQDRHINREQYYKEQAYTAKNYVIPFVNTEIPITSKTSVLEIGCGEGGNLLPFLEMGCEHIVGVDLSKSKIENAKKYFADYPNHKNIEFLCADIYDVDNLGTFDFIMMRDVLEHIHDQEKFMLYVKKFLKPDGKFYLGFPPWVNPFGGHQQICKSRVLSKLPFFHILPVPIYKFILKAFGETKGIINGLLEVKATAISINRFERILIKSGYKKDKRVFYLINPNYEIKFKLKPRKINKLIGAIPYLRDFLITTNYYLISLK
jgi:SAM-dependent methyltransferase